MTRFIPSGRPGGYFIPLKQPLNCAADTPCKTCPFVVGNDAALAKLFVEMITPQLPGYRFEKILRPVMRVVARLFPKLLTKLVRWTATKQVQTGAPFICHSSVYKFEVGAETHLQPPEQWRVCKGSEKVPR